MRGKGECGRGGGRVIKGRKDAEADMNSLEEAPGGAGLATLLK